MRIILLILLMVSTAHAQDSTIAYNRRYVIKVAPLSLIDTDATVQLGLEIPVGPRTSFQTELGYGTNKLPILGSDYRAMKAGEIWRIRNEFRRYTGRYRTNRSRNIQIKAVPPLGNYWAVELMGKQINVIDKEYQNGSGSTGFQADVRKSRFVIGSHLKIGRQFALYGADKKPGRVLFDVYFGAGIRYTNVTNYSGYTAGRLPDIMFKQNRFDLGSKFWPSLAAGLKMGFSL